MIDFNCPGCGHFMSMDEKHAGQTGKCPKCRHHMAVPLATPEVQETLDIQPIAQNSATKQDFIAPSTDNTKQKPATPRNSHPTEAWWGASGNDGRFSPDSHLNPRLILIPIGLVILLGIVLVFYPDAFVPSGRKSVTAQEKQSAVEQQRKAEADFDKATNEVARILFRASSRGMVEESQIAQIVKAVHLAYPGDEAKEIIQSLHVCLLSDDTEVRMVFSDLNLKDDFQSACESVKGAFTRIILARKIGHAEQDDLLKAWKAYYHYKKGR